MRTICGAPGIEHLRPDELRGFCGTADQLSIQPDWLACVVSFETAGTFSPSQRNRWAVIDAQKRGVPYQGAVGLIQFMPSTAKLLGTSPYGLAQMTVLEQLPFVERYLGSYRGRMDSLENTYLGVFYPAAIGQEDSWVVAARDGSKLNNHDTVTPAERDRSKAIYRQNAGFDSGDTGFVTRGDVCRTIREVQSRAAQNPRVDVPDAPVDVSAAEAQARGAEAIAEALRDDPSILDGDGNPSDPA
jgi:hypothetical protein